MITFKENSVSQICIAKHHFHGISDTKGQIDSNYQK